MKRRLNWAHIHSSMILFLSLSWLASKANLRLALLNYFFLVVEWSVPHEIQEYFLCNFRVTECHSYVTLFQNVKYKQIGTKLAQYKRMCYPRVVQTSCTTSREAIIFSIPYLSKTVQRRA